MSSGYYQPRRQYWVTLAGGRSINLGLIVMVSERRSEDEGEATVGLRLLPAGGGPPIDVYGDDRTAVLSALSRLAAP